MNANIERARLLINQSRYAMAIDELNAVIGASPRDPMAFALMAICLSEQQQNDRALEAARQAISLWPDWAYAHYVMAHVLQQMDKYDAATRAIQRAIELDPEDADHHTLLSSIHVQRSKWREALASADQALALDPVDTTAANLRSMALMELGRRHEAGLTNRTSLQRDPEDPFTHTNEGWRLVHAGQVEQAVVHFREALRLDPNFELARQGVVQAMKARNPIYHYLLMVLLFLGRLPLKVRIGLLIGVILFANLLDAKRASATGPNASTVYIAVDLLIIGYFLFVLASWLASPLMDLVLQMDKFGRQALSRDERRMSLVLGLVTIPMVCAAIWTAARLGVWVGMTYLFALIAVGVAIRQRTTRNRWIMGAITTALIGTALAHVVMVNRDGIITPTTQNMRELVVWGSIACTWVGGALLIRDLR